MDSPRAIELARGYGAEANVARFPDAYVGISYRRRFGVTETAVRFITRGDFCEVTVYVDGETGGLLTTDSYCMEHPSAASSPASSTP